MKNFKDTGIEWLGEIPQHWKLIKCKNFFVLKSIPIGDLWNKTKLLSLTLNGVIERDINNPEGKFPSDFSTYQIVKEGDLIFCLFDVAETPRTIGLSKLNGMITSAYTIFEIKNQEKRFLEYFFINLDNRKNLKFLYRGLRNTISKEDLLNLKIPLPPLKEQEQIAKFLDEKCEQIANFIEKKEKLISLLKEQKQVLINETITKGLDKNVNFKDTGIEHLGKIPQHWEIRRLATFGRFFKGGNISRQDLVESGDSALLYGDIYMNYEISTSFLDSKISKSTSLGAIPIYKGDILFAGSGETKEDIGKNIVYLGKDKAFAGGDVIIFRQKENNALYLSYALNTKYTKFYKSVESKGEIIVHIYASNLKDIKIPLPPLKEQKQIAQFLDSEISKIDKIIEKTKKQIELIKEYKTTLINQAVCGRINL